MKDISAVVLAKNEEKNIDECLKSLKWCDELVVVDDNSQDRTAELAKEKGANVYKHSLQNDFSLQRNFGLQKAKGEWVLFVDADERISSDLKNEIITLINLRDRVNKLNGYFIPRADFMWGRQLKHGETGNVKLLRLALKGSGEWGGKVHEQWKIEGAVGELRNHIEHFPHQTISEFLEEISLYTNIRAMELYKKSVKANLLDIISYSLTKFLLNYIVRRGFMDGIPGLLVAIMMSFHSFLIRSKLFLLWKRIK